MIEEYYVLSCFVLEKPFRVEFSGVGRVVGLVDGLGNIYEFRLPQQNHYEVLLQPLRK